MATSKNVTLRDTNGEPVEVEWSDIHPDGSETVRTGLLWADAPSLGGMRTWWVLPNDAFARDGEVCRVAFATRRHRCGRRADGGRYLAKTGRYVDAGELFRETDADSRFGLAPPGMPTAIAGRPRTSMAQTQLALFEQIISTYERTQ